MFPNLIVFGGMRCGTTSLYRYLSAHEDVYSSARKELDIFYSYIQADTALIESKYAEAFTGYNGNEAILLEASPRYARKYQEVSNKITETIPDVKIIYLIRDPVERLISVYWSIKRSGMLKKNVTLDHFVVEIVNQSTKVFTNEEEAAELLLELDLGKYSKIIETLVGKFGRERVYVECLENLSRDPLTSMTNICKFIGIDASYYIDFAFSVENSSIDARWKRLYQLALKLNASLEPLLNRMPKIRASIRRAHHLVNSGKSKQLNSAQRKLLENYYKEDRERLRDIFRSLDLGTLPIWLSR